MAKRFTDTEKWGREWFRELPVKMKVAWEYLRDNCDHAGIWGGDFKAMSFQVGAKITLKECEQHFGPEKFRALDGGRCFLPTFVEFQYGKLNPDNRAHKSVIQKLEKVGPLKPLASPIEGAANGAKDKDKDKEKDKELEKEKEKEAAQNLDAQFEEIWKRYPRKIDKQDALERFRRLVKTVEEARDMYKAVGHFAKSQADQTNEKFIRHFTTFVGTEDNQRWREWINGDPQKQQRPSQAPQHKVYRAADDPVFQERQDDTPIDPHAAEKMAEVMRIAMGGKGMPK